MSAVDTRRAPPAYALQAVASSVCTVLGELLGSSVTGKLVAGILGAWLGAFLTAPGRRHGRRIVAVVLLLLLLDAGKALAAGVRRRPRPPAAATRSSMLPASWSTVAAATAVGFVLGTSVTAAGHAVAGDGVRLTSTHQQQQAAPPEQAQQTQTQTTQQQQQVGPSGTPPGGSPSADVTVPSVSGLRQATALKALKDAGLRPTVSSRSSDSVPSETAIGTDPAAGTKAKRGSRVTLLVSSGSAGVTVPDVRGQNVETATARLKQLGLTSTVTADPVCSDAVCTVDSETPSAGATVPTGTTVTLHEAPPKPG